MKATVIVFYADLLLAALPKRAETPLPSALVPKLTPRELERVVTLLGKGWPLARAIDQIQQERPTLPFDPREDVDPQEAA